MAIALQKQDIVLCHGTQVSGNGETSEENSGGAVPVESVWTPFPWVFWFPDAGRSPHRSVSEFDTSLYVMYVEFRP